MLRFFTLLFFIVFFTANAQTTAPKFINYQGIARDAAGTPITSQFDIQFIITGSANTVHSEIQTNILPNQFGLFSTQIGKAPNTLTVSSWNTGPYMLNVFIKTTGSFSLVGTQELVSVPFSLFAGDVPTSYTNNVLSIGASSYSISSGTATTPTINGTGLVTVSPNTGPLYSVNVPTPALSYATTGNVLTLTQGTAVTTATLTGTGSSTIGMTGVGIASVNPISGSAFTVTVPSPTLSFTAGNVLVLNQGVSTSAVISPTLTGDVIGPVAANTVVAIRNSPVAAVTPLNNQVLTFVSGNWTPVTPSAAPVAPWQKVSTNVSLVVSTDNVGIGTGSPSGRLEVTGTNTTNMSIIKASNNNSANTFPVLDVSSNGTSGILATDLSSGGGTAGNFTSNNGVALYGSSSGSVSSIQGFNSNSSLTAYAGSFGGGILALGKNNSTGNALAVQNASNNDLMFVRNDGNVSINTATPGNKLSVLSANATAAIFGTNAGSPTNSLSSGVYGKTNNVNALAAGLFGENIGAGPSVYGLKNSTVAGGNAARFEIANTANTADGVFALTQGTGPAVHAAAGTSVTSALALLLDNGHVASTGAAPTTTVITSLVGGSIGLLGTSTDIAGRINITFGTGPFTANTFGGVIFNKPYTVAPIVILTPVTAAAATATVHVTSTVNGFTITHDSSPAGGSVQNFNYIIIETK